MRIIPPALFLAFCSCNPNPNNSSEYFIQPTDSEMRVVVISFMDSMCKSEQVNSRYIDSYVANQSIRRKSSRYDYMKFSKHPEYNFFDPADSAYIIFQDSGIQKMTWNSSSYPKYRWTSREKIKNDSFAWLSAVSIPVFSRDKTKAMLYGSWCGPICGDGAQYFLERKKGKWFIIKKR